MWRSFFVLRGLFANERSALLQFWGSANATQGAISLHLQQPLQLATLHDQDVYGLIRGTRYPEEQDCDAASVVRQ
jgi:hypothetical protein